jgi:hypothetical protein
LICNDVVRARLAKTVLGRVLSERPHDDEDYVAEDHLYNYPARAKSKIKNGIAMAGEGVAIWFVVKNKKKDTTEVMYADGETFVVLAETFEGFLESEIASVSPVN